MGNGEEDTPTETPKSSSTQEQPPPSSPAALFPDWASYQAYYNPVGTPPIPPPGFFHSPVASSPQAHPYMWAPQHMIPPYGTPPPYVAMYPHGGVYAHRSIPSGSHPYGPYAMPSPNGTADVSFQVAVTGGTDRSVEGKSSPLKKCKGSLGSLNMLTGNSGEVGKTSGASGNGSMSQSGESGNEGSSEGSDANSQNGSQQKPCCEQGSHADEAATGSSICSAPSEVAGAPLTQTMANQTMVMMGIPPSSIPSPTTNLNIGMDFWGGHPHASIATMKRKTPSVAATGPIAPAILNGSQDDERELRRQRRKQSNRESARRSRLRRQVECEELAKHVETLKEENSSLRDELEHMREECEKLAAENASLSEKLDKHQA